MMRRGQQNPLFHVPLCRTFTRPPRPTALTLSPHFSRLFRYIPFRPIQSVYDFLTFTSMVFVSVLSRMARRRFDACGVERLIFNSSVDLLFLFQAL